MYMSFFHRLPQVAQDVATPQPWRPRSRPWRLQHRAVGQVGVSSDVIPWIVQKSTWGFPWSWVVPQKRWMVYFMENPIKLDDLGSPYFRKLPNHQLIGGKDPMISRGFSIQRGAGFRNHPQ